MTGIDAGGRRINALLTGRVLDGDGAAPINNVTIEIWQCRTPNHVYLSHGDSANKAGPARQKLPQVSPDS